jgi:mRNA interferase HigB
MRVISKAILRDFWEHHSDAKEFLQAWYREVKNEDWDRPAKIRERYISASFVKDRVVFNIHGNKYRVIVKINYEKRVVFVRFVGTHKEYDAIKVEEV